VREEKCVDTVNVLTAYKSCQFQTAELELAFLAIPVVAALHLYGEQLTQKAGDNVPE